MAWLPAALLLELDPDTVIVIGSLLWAPLSLVFLAAAVTWWMVRREPDQAAGWATFSSIVVSALWIALERYLDLQGIAQVAGFSIPAALALFGFAPSLLAVLACWTVGHRAAVDAPPLRTFLFYQAEQHTASLYFPFLFSIVGYLPPAPRLPTYCVALVIIGIVGGLLSRRSRRLTSNDPLSEGELYRRAHHLAERAETKLRTIRIVPDDTWEGANAYAIWPGRIALSEGLVKSAPPDQLDATVVHELAHLRHRDTPRLLLTAAALLFAIHTALRPALALVIHPAWITVPQSALFLFFVSYTRRRAEYRADALASDLISPEAEVRNLLRPHRVDQAPLTRHPLLEALDTHPSALHRIQAIAQRHGRSSEWLRAILLEECPNEDLQSLAGSIVLAPPRVSTLG